MSLSRMLSEWFASRPVSAQALLSLAAWSRLLPDSASTTAKRLRCFDHGWLPLSWHSQQILEESLSYWTEGRSAEKAIGSFWAGEGFVWQAWGQGEVVEMGLRQPCWGVEEGPWQACRLVVLGLHQSQGAGTHLTMATLVLRISQRHFKTLKYYLHSTWRHYDSLLQYLFIKQVTPQCLLMTHILYTGVVI